MKKKPPGKVQIKTGAHAIRSTAECLMQESTQLLGDDSAYMC
jgi:hypothetical protein